MMGLWWILLIILALAVGGYFVRGSSRPAQSARREPARRETPLEALERRYAEGEISTEEYEERKQALRGDT